MGTVGIALSRANSLDTELINTFHSYFHDPFRVQSVCLPRCVHYRNEVSHALKKKKSKNSKGGGGERLPYVKAPEGKRCIVTGKFSKVFFGSVEVQQLPANWQDHRVF